MSEAEWIFSVVKTFYDKAKDDILIGYHFRNIHDFETHIPRIASFWDIQLLGETQQKGGPPFDMMNSHLPLGIKRGELGRWLVLFRQTLKEKTTKDFSGLSERWEERLKIFEGIFLRFLAL